MEVVVVDADVLIPILSCDFLLTGLDLAVYELAVSPKVLDEVEHHLITDFPSQDAARLAVRAEHMHFALRNASCATSGRLKPSSPSTRRTDTLPWPYSRHEQPSQ